MKSVVIKTASVVILSLSLVIPALANNPNQKDESSSEIDRAISAVRREAGTRVKTPSDIKIRDLKLQGWDYIYKRLVSDYQLNPKDVAAVLSDSRMPERGDLFFSLDPKEPRNPYRRRLKRSEFKNALSFYRENWFFFRQASLQYQIPEHIILAILQIETRCGVYTGKSRVLHRLARLASAADPENIQVNYRKKRSDKGVTVEKVKARAQYLEDIFLPHVAASFKLARSKNVHPLELRGSVAGALGLPQFLPGNYLTYGVDGNGDDQINLFSAGDAIYSVGNFLRAHGWHQYELPRKEQEKAIWHYNRSQPYIDTVLQMAKRLAPKIKSAHNEIREEILAKRVSQIIPVNLSIPGRAANVPRFVHN